MKTGNSTAIISPVSRVTAQNTGSGFPHTDEELIRRRRNYTKPYMQNEAHIQWIAEPGWCFERAAYDRMVEAFRDVYKQAESADLLRLPSALFHP